MIITTKKEYLEYLARFISTDETRYYLKYIYFDADGSIVATDGHQFGYFKKAFKAPESFPEKGVAINIDKTILSTLKAYKIKGAEIDIEIDNYKASILGITTDILTYRDYPDWKIVLNYTAEAVQAIGLNPKLLKNFQIKLPIKMEFTGVNSAIEITVPEYKDEFRGFLMPCRLSNR